MGLSSRRRRKERGASIVEAAFVTPVFLALIFGVMELGFLFRNYLSISNASLAGARAASVAGDDPAADFLVVRTVAHGIEAIGARNVDFVVVYDASPAPGGQPLKEPPASCLFGSSSALSCNRYTKAEFFLSLREPDGTTPNWECDPTTGRDRFWCPTDRETIVGNADYVGVFVQVNHQYLTGLFGDDTKLTSNRVIRIEPTKT
jgi:hypothetical protein